MEYNPQIPQQPPYGHPHHHQQAPSVNHAQPPPSSHHNYYPHQNNVSHSPNHYVNGAPHHPDGSSYDAGPSTYRQPYNQHHQTYSSTPLSHDALPNPHSQGPTPTPTVEAVPSPMPKVAYAPPVFQTFQERKRAKEMALRAQAMGSSPSSSSISTPPLPSTHPSYAILPQPRHRYSSPSPSSMGPPAATVAMMGPSSPLSGPPAPPARSRSPSISRSASPAPSQPLPPPRRLPSPSPSSHNQQNPLPNPVHLPFTPSRIATTPTATSAWPTQQPIQANLERSDTLSSVKSLDRAFSSSPTKRALPKPPVGVNSSKSLDRGIPSSAGIGMGEGFKRGMSRKQPSVVDEGSDDGLIDSVNRMTLDERKSTTSPRPPSIVTPDVQLPEDTGPRTPAKYFPLPVINVPDSDHSSIASTSTDVDQTPRAGRTVTPHPSSPGIQFSGLPVIAVSSSDTDDFDQGGEISFSVPSINVDNVPSIHVPVQSQPQATATGQGRRTRIEVGGSAIICSGCDNPIIGRIVNAMNQRWHPQCFMCAQCGELLEHVSSYEYEGKAYCHLDYHDKFAHKCHHCQTPIVDSRFVTLNDPSTGFGQRYYHELHFFCSECGDPFLDPSKSSAPGTESSQQDGEGEGEGEGETNAFVIHKGHPYCEHCHLKLHKPKCKACSKPIPDVAINAMGSKWHKECFVCALCGDEFANNLFFPKDGKAFCTTCYEDMITN